MNDNDESLKVLKMQFQAQDHVSQNPMFLSRSMPLRSVHPFLCLHSQSLQILDLHVTSQQIYSVLLLPVTHHQAHVTTEALSSTSSSNGETLYSVEKHWVCCFSFSFLECYLHPLYGVYTLLHDLFTWHSILFFWCRAKT